MKDNSRSLMMKANVIVLTYDNQFKTEYDELIEPKNVNQCVMVLMKNVTTTTIGDSFF
jgi:hypothetical protein